MSRHMSAFGVQLGTLRSGKLGKITDVPGVFVGHATICDQRHHTGVTVILPCEDNMFARKLTAAAFVLNGFGKTQGLVQIGELGTLETPIALTNTLNVGIVHNAMVSYMAERCAQDGIEMHSINPVVGECNDSQLNDILDRPVHEEHVRMAIRQARQDFDEGCVGAGAGTICHGLKGGIGSASRLIPINGKNYVLGVLVQSNHGVLSELTIGGRRIGAEIIQKRHACTPLASVSEKPDQGSIMVILATNLPLNDRQLGRVLRRCGAGLARCGSYFGHGSGDVMIGFTTTNRVPHEPVQSVITQQVLAEPLLELAFLAAVEATEEAVVSSLFEAEETRAPDGKIWESLRKYW